MSEFYKQIQGWFDFESVYDEAVRQAPTEGVFVEVGAWLGRSTAYLAQRIKDSSKRIRLYVVDTWQGSPNEPDHQRVVRDHGGSVYGQFLENMRRANVDAMILPLPMESARASQSFSDHSVDFVFIDGSHQYEDVLRDLVSWFPKIRHGGVLAGHDYQPGWPGVVRAVNEFFPPGIVKRVPANCYWVRKSVQESAIMAAVNGPDCVIVSPSAPILDSRNESSTSTARCLPGAFSIGKNAGDPMAEKTDLLLHANPDVHNRQGVKLAQEGRLDEAVASFRQAVQLKPDYAEAYSNLGTALAEQEKLDEATANLVQALKLRPNYSKAHNNLGNVLSKQLKLDEAVEHFHQALSIEPNYAEAHNNLGNALRDLGQLEEAIACFESALRLRMDYAEAYNNLGIALAKQGKLEDALREYDKALQLRPDYVEAHMSRALAWLMMGNFEQGWPEYEWRWKGLELGSGLELVELVELGSGLEFLLRR